MPNGIQSGRDCARCRAHTTLEPVCQCGYPWEPVWYCYTCCRWYEITDCAEQLRRVLIRNPTAYHHAGARPAARVFASEELTYMICDFVVVYAFAELHWLVEE